MDLSPKQIVHRLDKYIIGQDEAKKAVAIALRNRYRRAQLPQEIREEITFTGSASQELFAIINDDTNEVGSVHLGFVHRFELEDAQVAPNEKALADLAFRTLDELAGPLYERLETWSAICVDALKG